jgi:hypothetical protein
MKKLIAVGAALSMLVNTGCLCTWVETKDVTVVRCGVLNDTKLEDAYLKWGNADIGVGSYANKGDAAMADAIGSAITSGIIAWFTYGTAPAVKAAVTTALKESSTNCVAAACSPGARP